MRKVIENKRDKKMTEQLLLEIWTGETRLRREFIKEESIVHRLRFLCKAVKTTAINTALVNRLKDKGKAKVGGVYQIYLYDEESDPQIIAEYKEYVRSQLPTFVEYILRMEELYCLDVNKVRQTLQENIQKEYSAELLSNRLIELQKAEVDKAMWYTLNKVVEGSQEDNEFENVIKWLDESAKRIVENASYGAAHSSSPISNVLEDVEHSQLAKWYREHAKEIRSLVEGEDYQ